MDAGTSVVQSWWISVPGRGGADGTYHHGWPTICRVPVTPPGSLYFITGSSAGSSYSQLRTCGNLDLDLELHLDLDLELHLDLDPDPCLRLDLPPPGGRAQGVIGNHHEGVHLCRPLDSQASGVPCQTRHVQPPLQLARNQADHQLGHRGSNGLTIHDSLFKVDAAEKPAGRGGSRGTGFRA